MNLVRTKEASKITGFSVGSLYVYARIDKKNNITNRFINKDGKLYVNVDQVYKKSVREETQLEFERLFFMLEEYHKHKIDFHKKLAVKLGCNTGCVASYFNTNFLSGHEITKQKYVNAMTSILKEDGKYE